uniref:Uncharacterized protein n=1 Tax=viral metagenome TaxID=1070528 RepID=A0A6C0ETZ7_9ZZZZ
MTSQAFSMRNVYKEGRREYYELISYTGKKIDFAGQVPEYFAMKYFFRILGCANCQTYGYWGGCCIGMCANCGFETGTQKGFLNYGQEYEYKSTTHLPSVFDEGQYLSKDWDLKRVGDKSFVNTIGIMVDELYEHLLYRFCDEKQPAIIGLCDYLRSLDHEPRQAILRINEMRNIPEELLVGRNWADFDASDDNEDELIDETDYSSLPDLIPVLTRTDTEYHYGLEENVDTAQVAKRVEVVRLYSLRNDGASRRNMDDHDSESEVDYRMYLSDRRRAASFDTDDDAVSRGCNGTIAQQREQGVVADPEYGTQVEYSEISNCVVENVDFSMLTQEQQEKIDKVIDDACK